MIQIRIACTLFFLSAQTFIQALRAEVKLPQLIRDSMVLQREATIKIWGWASPGEKISVKFNSKVASAKADNSGKWLIKLPAMKAGGPFTMQIDASNQI